MLNTITTPGADKIEMNDKGELLLNVNELARAAWAGQRAGYNQIGYSRYNGGWVKNIMRLDKSRTNGYSLVGDFVEGTTWLRPGVYLDCSIEGSRKHPYRQYCLFRLTPTGEVEQIATVGDTRDWAIKLWPHVEAALGPDATAKPVAESAVERVWRSIKDLTEQEQAEIRNRLLAEL